MFAHTSYKITDGQNIPAGKGQHQQIVIQTALFYRVIMTQPGINLDLPTRNLMEITGHPKFQPDYLS
jgi:hypothetical protein